MDSDQGHVDSDPKQCPERSSLQPHPQVYTDRRVSLPLRTSSFDSERYPYEKQTKNRTSLNDKMRGRFEDILVGPKQNFNAAGTLREWAEERARRLGKAAEQYQKRDRGRQEEEEPPLLYEILSGRRTSRAADVVGISPRRGGTSETWPHFQQVEMEDEDDEAGWLKAPRPKCTGDVERSLIEPSQDYPIQNHLSTSSSGTWVEPNHQFLPDATSTPTHLTQGRSPGHLIAPLRGALKRSPAGPYDESRQTYHPSSVASHHPRSPVHSSTPPRNPSLPTSYYASSPVPFAHRHTSVNDEPRRRDAQTQHAQSHRKYPTGDGHAYQIDGGPADYDPFPQPYSYPNHAANHQFHTPPGQSPPAVPHHFESRRRHRSPTSSSDDYATHTSRKRFRHHKHHYKPSKHRRSRWEQSRYSRHSRRRLCSNESSSCSSCCSASASLAYDSAYDSSSPSPSASSVPRLMGVTDGAFANYNKPKPKPVTPKRTLPGRKARYAYQVQPKSPRTPEGGALPTQQDQEMPSTQSTDEPIQEFSDHSQDAFDTACRRAENPQVAMVAARAADMMARAEERQRREERRVRFDLSPINEDDEESEDLMQAQRPAGLYDRDILSASQQALPGADVEPGDSDVEDIGWVDENGVKFFSDGGDRGFRINRDHY